MTSYEDKSIRDKWTLCMYKRNERLRRFYMEGAGNQMQHFYPEPDHSANIYHFFSFVLKIAISFCCCAVNLFIDSVTNKWLWNVIFVIVNLTLDIFFHLVLALAAVMVVLILNIDDLYVYQQNENKTRIAIREMTSDEDHSDIIEEETCPNLV